ncbi:zinc ABC transporter substrate-binding protein [Pseudomonas sp. 148P]|uniref:Zinc ABC transporter substrate-binding protein n=1 Tax=Pseudomonas ulcerans TaxID=3115852 RepID=A0ABU7HSC7_9PSED|nr:MULTISPECIES: zinc ABC transporter substrate-binding protein [unclassified Pseudomonas]MEE1923409.1 zinc ABC transporter substrate-binding protein [Pseudomonas sp. 147P]MEE1934381.1 zinc ABC transporter substrate-binding protein [Pseudomonas sp. 148P]
MNPTLKHLSLALLLAGLPLAAHAAPAAKAAAQQGSGITVLASLPVTYGLGSLLLDGTSVQLQRAAPDNLPASRQPSYFSGRGAASLQKAAGKADAVIGLRSIWSDDPLYPVARRSNIRIVEIDAARPVDGALPGIAAQGDNVIAGYPWLNPSNMGRMADVMANDLGRLSPADQTKIQANLAGLKRQLLDLSASSEAKLAEADNLSVVNLSDRLGYLIGGLNLDLIDHPQVVDDKWSEEQLKHLGEELKAQDVALVLHHKQPPEAVAQVIAASGARLVVVDTDGADSLAGLKAGVESVVAALTGSKG